MVQKARKIDQQREFLSAAVLHKEPSQVLWPQPQSSLFPLIFLENKSLFHYHIFRPLPKEGSLLTRTRTDQQVAFLPMGRLVLRTDAGHFPAVLMTIRSRAQWCCHKDHVTTEKLQKAGRWQIQKTTGFDLSFFFF